MKPELKAPQRGAFFAGAAPGYNAGGAPRAGNDERRTGGHNDTPAQFARQLRGEGQEWGKVV